MPCCACAVNSQALNAFARQGPVGCLQLEMLLCAHQRGCRTRGRVLGLRVNPKRGFAGQTSAGGGDSMWVLWTIRRGFAAELIVLPEDRRARVMYYEWSPCQTSQILTPGYAEEVSFPFHHIIRPNADAVAPVLPSGCVYGHLPL